MKKRYLEIQNEYPEANVHIISRQPVPPDDDEFNPDGNRLYCPICMTVRKFEKHSGLRVRRCSVCHLSDNEAAVKDFNNLWEKEG